MLGAGEGFYKLGDARKRGDLKLRADTCLQEEVVGGLVSYCGLGKCRRKVGRGRIFHD